MEKRPALTAQAKSGQLREFTEPCLHAPGKDRTTPGTETRAQSLLDIPISALSESPGPRPRHPRLPTKRTDRRGRFTLALRILRHLTNLRTCIHRRAPTDEPGNTQIGPAFDAPRPTAHNQPPDCHGRGLGLILLPRVPDAGPHLNYEAARWPRESTSPITCCKTTGWTLRVAQRGRPDGLSLRGAAATAGPDPEGRRPLASLGGR